MHYLHGIPMGRICQQIGIEAGSLVEIFHRLAHLVAQVPQAVLGQEPLPGVLVVDRYAGYNKAPCAIQYCYAHLLRQVQDLEKEFPEDSEIAAFVATVAPLLSLAMGLQSQPISDPRFYAKAAQVKGQLQAAMNRPAQHLGIRSLQDLFRENEKHLYHWAQDRRIPAHNNLAERDLRPTVIARKVSFGSQSDAGARTRGILTSVLYTLKKKQGFDVASHLKYILDKLAEDIHQDSVPLLFPRASPRHCKDYERLKLFLDSKVSLFYATAK